MKPKDFFSAIRPLIKEREYNQWVDLRERFLYARIDIEYQYEHTTLTMTITKDGERQTMSTTGRTLFVAVRYLLDRFDTSITPEQRLAQRLERKKRMPSKKERKYLDYKY